MSTVERVSLNVAGQVLDVPLDLLWVDLLEQETGKGVLELNELFVEWQSDPMKMRAGLLFRIVLATVRRIDPTMTADVLASRLDMGQFLKDQSRVVGTGFAKAVTQLAGEGPASNPKGSDASGAGSSPTSASTQAPQAN